MTDADTADDYCADLLRRSDYDRYLTAAVAPDTCRAGLFAVYAFNLEVAKTRDVVSEPLLGQIRLQWWRETLDGVFAGTPRDHPVARALAAAVERHGLDRGGLDRLIDAREGDLDDTAPRTLEDLENYADATGAPPGLLALRVLGADSAVTEVAARHVGIAWALTGLLRAAPFHAAAKRQFLPVETMAAEGARPADYFELRGGEALARVAARVADRAAEHLRLARRHRSELPKAALPALLLGRLADRYLRRIRRIDHDILRRPAEIGRLGRQLAVLRGALGGRY